MKVAYVPKTATSTELFDDKHWKVVKAVVSYIRDEEKPELPIEALSRAWDQCTLFKSNVKVNHGCLHT